MKQWFGGGWNCRKLELPHPENNGSNTWHRGDRSSWSARVDRVKGGFNLKDESKTNLMGKSASAPESTYGPIGYRRWSSED